MKSCIGIFIGLLLSVSVGAESLLEGRVRLESGQPVADAQVQLFDLNDLERGAITRAMTDGTGYFSLPLAALTGQALPARFELGPNYPNPFNPSTNIPYQLAALSEVRLEVFNLLGQRIATLVDGERPAGFHTATWHATDAAGRAVGAGVYIYRMTVGVERQTGRMVLVDGQAGVSAAGAASVLSGVSSGGGSDGAESQVYGLLVSGEGLAPYVDSSFRVEAGMVPVELVVSSGHSGGKAADDDCAFCDLFDALHDEAEGPGPSGKAQAALEAPPAPTNLRFDAPTDSSCTVRWDAAAGATDYDVNYRPAVGGRWTNEPHRGTGLSNTIHDLEPGIEYRWAVRAENGDGSSAWVFGPNFTTLEDETDETTAEEAADGQAPPAPTNLRFDAPTDSSCTVRWDAAAGATDYDVNYKPAVGGRWTNEPHRGTGLSNTIHDLEPGIEYRWAVRAENGEGRSAWVFGPNFTTLEDETGETEEEEGDTPEEDEQVTIPDANLRAAIEAALGKTSGAAITDGEMKTLKVLDAQNKGIRDLEGLQSATNLTSLSLGRAKSENMYGISPGVFAQVEYLPAAEVNEISDVSVLSSLTKLTYLDLHRNNISDVAPLSANTGLGSGDQIDITGNPLNAISINTHIPALQARGVNVSFDEVVVSVNGDPQIYNDNVFVLPVAENLVIDALPLQDYAARFYEYFDDAFDFLMIWSNLYYREDMARGYAGSYYHVMNDVQGIGVSIFSNNSSWGSAGKLGGVIHMPDFFSYGVLKHEVMHQWANFIIPTSAGSHWGFSSANGVLGGFDIDNLVDHGGGRYTAGRSWWPSGSFGAPYGPIELYLAGFIPSEDVPDILVAEDGKWLLDDEGNIVEVEDDEVSWMFTASRFKTYTIEDIIAEHGPRVPDHSQSQKDFRAAAILLIDEDHPATKEVLETVSRNVSWFSHAGSDEFDQHNFYEATGGRATITMDDLPHLQRRASAKRPVPSSFGTPPPPIVDVGNDRENLGRTWRPIPAEEE